MANISLTTGRSMKTGTCVYCGKTFGYYEAHSKGRFCSHECYWADKGKIKSKRNADGFYEHICPRCGKLVVNKTWSPGRFCRKCVGTVAKEKRVEKKGSEAHAWKGGRRIDGYGYVKVHSPGHPFADVTNYVREHIMVAVEQVGAEKFKELGGVVHHINGNKQDNQMNNLWICTKEQNADYNKQLLQIAFRLVNTGHIVFENGQYTCPLLSDEQG